MNIQKNVLLANFTTFKIGGCARYFAVVKNLDDLRQAMNFAKQNSLPVFVLGGGSNILISDEGVNGLVIKMEIKGIDISDNQVTVGAGEVWDELVERVVEEGLGGLENLSYIPGTVGASVVQNIGAYGVEVKDFVGWVEVFDIQTGETRKIKGNFCEFGYRDSIFKKDEGKNFVVIRVAYNLKKDGELNINYEDIQNYISENNIKDLGTDKLREIIINIRKNKLPDWNEVGTAGSFFKNPVITKEQLENLLQKYPNLPHYPQQQKSWRCHRQLFKISLAYVLDKILGMRGYKEGGIGLYKNQPLVLVSCDVVTADEVKNFAKKITKNVKEKTGLDIHPEVVMW